MLTIDTGGGYVGEKEKVDILETVKVLMLLDKQSLLLIDSGARLLAARQDMDKDIENKTAKALSNRCKEVV